DRSQRTSAKLSIELGGFHGDLMAEAKVDLRDIKPELTGHWLLTRGLLTRVMHRLDDSLTTNFEAERDNEAAQR
ncbi:MAG: phage tail protein, partial [Rhodospirillales bacterium]|nr:phage tail protein [Rhodospirillales bacterium]